VNIGRNRSADGEPVSPRLLLTYTPGTEHAAGTSEICTQDAWPLDARLHLQEPPLLVKVADSVHPAHVEERPTTQELLSAHRVPAAGNRHGSLFHARSLDGANNVTECVRLNFFGHASEIQSGMDVVELSRIGYCANHASLCSHARIVIVHRIYYNTDQETYHFPIPKVIVGNPMSIGIKNAMSMRIVNGLKLAMKARRVTYGELGRRIRLSEPSVKRILSRGTLTIARLDEICSALDIGLPEILRLTGGQMGDSPDVLSLEQERALAEDPNLFACFYLLANGRSGRDVAREVGTDERTVRRWMARLDDLHLIEMRPKLRAKTRVASVVAWRTDGPLRRTYENRIRREFLNAAFDRHGESLQFLSAELSTASYKVLLRKLERLAVDFRDLADLDRSLPAREKQSVAAVLAARSWVFSMFAKDKKDVAG
jgi:transcriptional regulator with XRE-family HTH domain